MFQNSGCYKIDVARQTNYQAEGFASPEAVGRRLLQYFLCLSFQSATWHGCEQ
jgi:hypothetical protein